MYKIVVLIIVLLGLLAQPVFLPLAEQYLEVYFDPYQEIDFMIATLRVVIMVLCTFIFAGLPWKPICTKALAMVVSVVAIGLAYNYVDSFSKHEPSRVIQVESEDVGAG